MSNIPTPEVALMPRATLIGLPAAGLLAPVSGQRAGAQCVVSETPVFGADARLRDGKPAAPPRGVPR